MKESYFIGASEVKEIVGCGKSRAYQFIQQMNKELEAKGLLTFPGRVPRRYVFERFGILAIRSKGCGLQEHSFGANRREMGSGFAAIWCISISAIVGQNWNFMAGGYGGRTERPSSSGNAAGVKKRNILCASARSYPQCCWPPLARISRTRWHPILTNLRVIFGKC